MWDNLQLSGVGVDWWTVSVPEPEYSVQGYASATISHAAAHKVRISQGKLTFPLKYADLNASGLKVPL